MANSSDFTKRFNSAKRITDELKRGMNELNRAEQEKNEHLKEAIRQRKAISQEGLKLQKEFSQLGAPSQEAEAAYATDESVNRKQFDKASIQVAKAQTAFDLSMKGHRAAVVGAGKRSVRAQYKPQQLQSEISSSASGSAAFHSAFKNEKSYEALEKSQSAGYRQLGAQEQYLSTLDIGTPGGRQELKRGLDVKAKITEKMGVNQAAMSYMKKQGLDASSLEASSSKDLARVQKYQASREMTQQVATGEHGNLKQEIGKLDSLAADAAKAFAQLNKAAGEGGKELGGFTKSAKEAGKAYDTQIAKIKEMSAQGVGGGGGGAAGVLGGTANIIRDVSRIGLAGASAMRYRGVTSELERGQNRIGMANFQNARYENTMAAGRGDFGALRKQQSALYSEAAASGTAIGSAEERARRLEMYSHGGGALATGVEAAAGFILPGRGKVKAVMAAIKGATKRGKGGKANILGAIGGIAGDIVHAGASMATDAAMADRAYVDLKKGNSRTAMGLAAANMHVTYDAAINRVPDQLMNAYGAVATTGHDASRGSGGGSAGFKRVKVDEALSERMNEVGMGFDSKSAINFFALKKQGEKQMGTEFKTATISKAVDAEKNRQMEVGEYTTAASKLSDVGGKNESALGKIMQDAVTAGMDNSKNIVQMVNATVALSASSAAMGIDNTKTVAGVLGQGVTAGVNKFGMSRNIAVGATANVAELMNKTARGTQMTLGNVMEMSNIGKAFKDSTVREKEVIASLSMDQAMGLTKEKAEQIGIGRLIKGGKAGEEDLAKIRLIAKKQNLTDTLSAATDSKALSAGLKAFDEGKPLPEITQTALNQVGSIAQRQFSGQLYGEMLNWDPRSGKPRPPDPYIDPKDGTPQPSGRGRSAPPPSGNPGQQPNYTTGSRGGTGHGARNFVRSGPQPTYPSSIKNANDYNAELRSWVGTDYAFGGFKNAVKGTLNNGDNGGDFWKNTHQVQNSGIDCSGLVQQQLVREGLISEKTGKLGTAGLEKLYDTGAIAGHYLEPGEERQLGDIMVMKGHTAIVSGKGTMIGAEGSTGQVSEYNWNKYNNRGAKFYRPDKTAEKMAAQGTATEQKSGVTAAQLSAGQPPNQPRSVKAAARKKQQNSKGKSSSPFSNSSGGEQSGLEVLTGISNTDTIKSKVKDAAISAAKWGVKTLIGNQNAQAEKIYSNLIPGYSENKDKKIDKTVDTASGTSLSGFLLSELGEKDDSWGTHDVSTGVQDQDWHGLKKAAEKRYAATKLTGKAKKDYRARIDAKFKDVHMTTTVDGVEEAVEAQPVQQGLRQRAQPGAQPGAQPVRQPGAQQGAQQGAQPVQQRTPKKSTYVDPSGEGTANAGRAINQSTATTGLAEFQAGAAAIAENFGSIKEATDQMVENSKNLKDTIDGYQKLAESTATSLKFPETFNSNMDRLDAVILGLTKGVEAVAKKNNIPISDSKEIQAEGQNP